MTVASLVEHGHLQNSLTTFFSFLFFLSLHHIRNGGCLDPTTPLHHHSSFHLCNFTCFYFLISLSIYLYLFLLIDLFLFIYFYLCFHLFIYLSYLKEIVYWRRSLGTTQPGNSSKETVLFGNWFAANRCIY